MVTVHHILLITIHLETWHKMKIENFSKKLSIFEELSLGHHKFCFEQKMSQILAKKVVNGISEKCFLVIIKKSVKKSRFYWSRVSQLHNFKGKLWSSNISFTKAQTYLSNNNLFIQIVSQFSRCEITGLLLYYFRITGTFSMQRKNFHSWPWI